MVYMRLLAIVIFCLFGIAFAVAQDSRRVLKKYGAPDVERYRVTFDVAVTVSYGKDKTACEVLIQRRPSSILHEDTKINSIVISSAVVDKLLSELAPESARHGTPKMLFQAMGCAGNHTADYDNVRIIRLTNECGTGNDGKTTFVSVEWKVAQCTGVNRSAN
jgi:hypothetical protein